MIRVQCPKCTATFDVEDDMQGRLVNCQSCGTVFPVVPDSELADEVGTAPAGVAAYLRPDYEPEDPVERELVIAAARMRIMVPAGGLIVTGLIGFAATLCLGLYFIIYNALKMLGGHRRTDDLVGSVGATIGIGLYFLIIAAGGRSLRRLEYRGLGIAAAALSLLSLGVCGVWTIISIPGAFFGAWAIAALSSREVKHAMRWKRQERSATREV